jgi:hypothetical protein
LADAQDWTRYRGLEAHWIGDQRPDVRMRLQNQGSAFDHGRIGAFAAFGEALLDQALPFGEQRDALAGVTFAAGIVGEAFAIRCLREEPRQGVLANALRAGKKQCVRHTTGAQCATKRGNDLRIAAKFSEAHC